jgi:succinyl-diaminopimelate desuccinylase
MNTSALSKFNLETIKKLVSIPSTIGDTGAIENFISSELEKVKGTDVELLPVKGIGNNVVARIIHDRNNPTILLNGHLDTVEVCKGWTREPFAPVVDDDRLYGLGSADMKSGLAIGMHVFQELAGLGNVNVIFAGSVDEEGNSAGAFALLAKSIKADLCLIPEPSGGKLMMGCRGRVVFEVDVQGASAHGSRPGDGVNAISEASKFVGVIDSLPLIEHDKLGKGSFCTLEIAGGTRTLSVPDSCWLKIDRHYVTGETRESMLKQLEEAARNMKSKASYDISYWKARPTPFLEPYITENKDLAGVFAKSVGGDFSYGKSVGDYNAFAKRVPTVVYGPWGENWHAPDEWVSISSINQCVEGYARFIKSIGTDNKSFISLHH